MVKIEAISATSTPLWLLLSTFILVAIRCALTITETINPPKASSEIHWISPDQIKEKDRHGRKLIFYDFAANWCEPCKNMDKTAFMAKDIVQQLNTEFIPVKVIDRKREDGKNTPRIQELEDSFNVSAFPTIIIAVPNGNKVSDSLGASTPQSLRKMLVDAMAVAPYYSGKEELIASDIKEAAISFDTFLERSKWKHYRCAFAAIFDCVAHRELGENDKAAAVLTEAENELHDHNTFPYPIIESLAGKKTFDEVLKLASENRNHRILSYTYSAMNDYAMKNYEIALDKFQWVISNCEDKESFEYRIADRWLERTKQALMRANKNWTPLRAPIPKDEATN